MTTTYANLVDEISFNLAGYTLRQDRMTYLTEDVASDGLTLHLRDVTNIGKGTIEIDDELIWIDSYDRNSNLAYVAPFGRGFQGTSAKTHSLNSKVVVAPTFPRASIKKAINDTIDATFPNLFSVGTYTFTYNPAVSAYQIPAEVETILYVSRSVTGSSKEWLPVKGWRHDPMANVTSFTTGNSVSIYDRVEAGRTVQIKYIKKPATFQELSTPTLTNAQVFETVTGLPSSCKDVIMLGTAYRLASFIDPGRLNYSSAEADNADTKIQYGSGASTARFLLANFQSRLNEESAKLKEVYPTRIHYTRY